MRIAILFVFVFGSLACSEGNGDSVAERPVSNAAGDAANTGGVSKADFDAYGGTTIPFRVKVIGSISQEVAAAGSPSKATKINSATLQFHDSGEQLQFTAEVPAEGLEYLNHYFRTKLEVCETRNFEDIQRRLENDKTVTRKANKTANQLVSVRIHTPGGERNMSQYEAYQLIEFVGLKSPEYCEDN